MTDRGETTADEVWQAARCFADVLLAHLRDLRDPLVSAREHLTSAYTAGFAHSQFITVCANAGIDTSVALEWCDLADLDKQFLRDIVACAKWPDGEDVLGED